MSDRLASAQWEDHAAVARQYPYTGEKFWLGRAIKDGTPVGYRDDRHICLISGTRGGKGASIIINNLCLWPGSAFVIDPKGENATLTAARRGRGDKYCSGMGQTVHVLDPFNAARVDDSYRSSFNPLDALDPNSPATIDEAERIASSIVVPKDQQNADPFWDLSAHDMLHGLILHVLTSPGFPDDERNLITVRKLISRGEWRIVEAMHELGHDDKEIPSPYELLFRSMKENPAFDGFVADIGSELLSTMKASAKTFEAIKKTLSNHTKFLSSPGMRKVLATSTFQLSELKTKPEGMTVYLCLPPDYMEPNHFRWLRMMVSLTTAQMQITRGLPASGHSVLMLLDEFVQLKHMASIEAAVPYIAGFGVKMVFVLHSLEQLKTTYANWETFLSCSGLKIAFSIEDNFTRDYLSAQIGETEIIRELQNFNQSESENESEALGTSQGHTLSQSNTRGTSRSTSRSQTEGISFSETEGTSESRSETETFGTSQNTSWSSGSSSGSSYTSGPNGGSFTTSSGRNSSVSGSSGSSHSTSHGITHGTSHSTTKGTSSSFTEGETTGISHSDTAGSSDTTGNSQTRTTGTSRTAGKGRNETLHRRPLIHASEIGRTFARVDDTRDPRYPGLMLVLVTGADPFVIRKCHYFEDPLFIDCFSPHPDHPFVPAVTYSYSAKELLEALDDVMIAERRTITKWLVSPGQQAIPGAAVATITSPETGTVRILMPCSGKVATTAAISLHKLSSGEYAIPPTGDLFTVKEYPGRYYGIDPFAEIRKLPRRKPIEEAPQPPPARASSDGSVWPWIGWILGVGVAGVALYFLWRLAVYLFHVIPKFVQDHAVPFIIAGVIVGCLLIWGLCALIGRVAVAIIAVIGVALYFARGLIWDFVAGFVSVHYFIAACIAAAIIGLAVWAVREAMDY